MKNIIETRPFKDANGTAYRAHTVKGRKHGKHQLMHPQIIVRTGPRPVDIKRAERAKRKAERSVA